MSKQSYLVSVNVQQPNAPARTAAGSKLYTFTTRPGQTAVTGWGPMIRTPPRASTRTETGPGVQTQQERFVEFRRPFPTVYRGDRLLINGQTWEVILPPRAYARTLQCDVELVS